MRRPAIKQLAQRLLAIHRLLKADQQVAGGMFTVRGYDQSIVAGDSAVIGTIEYRYHFARTLDPGGEPIELPVIGPFQAYPRNVFARPDWDLILKAFMEGGKTWYVHTSDPNAGDFSEHHEDLFSVGVGVEVQFMRYVRAGVDLAWPRSKVFDPERGEDVDGGDSPEVHVLVTLMY